jgi:hypothetical protein
MCIDCVLTSPRITQVDPGDEPLPEVVLSHKMALRDFIHLVPRMTSIPCPLKTIRLVLNTLSDNSSGTFWAIWSVSTRPSGVLIMYGSPDATSVNFALLTHAELTKSCEAPESNNIMMG